MATLGTADDSAQADGENVLDYGQASTQALDWKPDEEGQLGKRDAVTVREAVEHYLDWYRAYRKAYDRIRSVFDAHILPELGDLRIDALGARRIRRWHQSLAEKPARLRGGQLREARTEDEKRARKATANHALTALKAALNAAADPVRCLAIRGGPKARAPLGSREENGGPPPALGSRPDSRAQKTGFRLETASAVRQELHL